MTDHGRLMAPARAIQLVVKYYPWSVLWILGAVGAVLIVKGLLIPGAVVGLMILAVFYHSRLQARSDKDRGDR